MVCSGLASAISRHVWCRVKDCSLGMMTIGWTTDGVAESCDSLLEAREAAIYGCDGTLCVEEYRKSRAYTTNEGRPNFEDYALEQARGRIS